MVRKPGSSSTSVIALPWGTASAEFEVPKSIAQKVGAGMGVRDECAGCAAMGGGF
jgi:hypothetical protein